MDKKTLWVSLSVIILAFSGISHSCIRGPGNNIDRKAVVGRHKIFSTVTNPKSPAQTGNGEFAFCADITGLQTFVPFNTLSQWGWHSFPLPEGEKEGNFRGRIMKTHGRDVRYCMPDSNHTELSDWLAGNPHKFNLGRIGFILRKSDGSIATAEDLKNTKQETDPWQGIIFSSFELEGTKVEVTTASHPSVDAIGVTVRSDLVREGRLMVFFEFPYADKQNMGDYLGDYSSQEAHSSVIVKSDERSAVILRKMDGTEYHADLGWTTEAKLLSGDTISSRHRFYLYPGNTKELKFTCAFMKKDDAVARLNADTLFEASRRAWKEFWLSGAAIDLSESRDPRWKELERRIVLSQYLMKVNEAGSLPPQESGLVNNGWYGRFHFEMIWWHGVHYALWNRWDQLEKSMHIYRDFLPGSKKRAEDQGYSGARWPKCTADLNRDWPHAIHALLIWQQPHPIYFAELDYRLHPGKATLDKWKDIVSETAEFMAGFAWKEPGTGRYILGPPVYIVSENTDPETTFNPAFELGYWRYGLRTAQAWRERQGLNRNTLWDSVLTNLAPLPQEDGVYVTHENIKNMWTDFTFEHPGLTGIFGMLPGDGADTSTFKRTLDRVIHTWDFNRTWGWDFPMVAMAAARTGNPELAVDMLLSDAPGFRFDEHGLATGGPFPYFPSNGALLTAVAMMAAGWDGASGTAPGFPKDGSWTVRYENFNRMP